MTAANEGQRWYVVRTHPGSELRTVAHLKRQGFEAYVPRYRKERRHARRRETVAAPLFPRYCFVSIDVTRQRWRSICSTLGVDRLIGCDAGPTAVRADIVNSLMRREDADGFVSLDRIVPFHLGQRVRLVEGMFSLCSALFEGLADKDRVAVLLDMLGRRVRVVVPETAVVAE